MGSCSFTAGSAHSSCLPVLGGVFLSSVMSSNAANGPRSPSQTATNKTFSHALIPAQPESQGGAPPGRPGNLRSFLRPAAFSEGVLPLDGLNCLTSTRPAGAAPNARQRARLLVLLQPGGDAGDLPCSLTPAVTVSQEADEPARQQKRLVSQQFKRCSISYPETQSLTCYMIHHELLLLFIVSHAFLTSLLMFKLLQVESSHSF